MQNKQKGVIKPKLTLPAAHDALPNTDGLSSQQLFIAKQITLVYDEEIPTQHFPLSPKVLPGPNQQPQLPQPSYLLPNRTLHAPFIQNTGSEVQYSKRPVDKPAMPDISYNKPANPKALIFETLSVPAVKKISAKKRFRLLFLNFLFLVSGIIFLALFGFAIIFLPSLTYKLTGLTLFFVASSYFIGIYMKIADRARHKMVTSTQIMRAIKKEPAVKKDEDMEHLQLIKQDTTGYLRALTKEDLEKIVQK